MNLSQNGGALVVSLGEMRVIMKICTEKGTMNGSKTSFRPETAPTRISPSWSGLNLNVIYDCPGFG